MIREANGRLLKAFTLPLQARSQLDADFLTIVHGLPIAMELGSQIWVELDST